MHVLQPPVHLQALMECAIDCPMIPRSVSDLVPHASPGPVLYLYTQIAVEASAQWVILRAVLHSRLESPPSPSVHDVPHVDCERRNAFMRP